MAMSMIHCTAVAAVALLVRTKTGRKMICRDHNRAQPVNFSRAVPMQEEHGNSCVRASLPVKRAQEVKERNSKSKKAKGTTLLKSNMSPIDATIRRAAHITKNFFILI